MNLKRSLFAAVVVTVIAGASVSAHHGTATSYDQKQSVTVKGTVSQFLWRNPHTALFVDVKAENGKTSNYTIEMWSPGLMVKQGYAKTTFKVGDQVALDVHPSLAGEPVGECLGCKILVNGKDPRNSRSEQ